MARRRRAEEAASTRLLDLWSPQEGFGAPVGCVASTYTLDAGHFEEECLARFIAMETDPKESARAYLIERETKLSQVFSCVLVDQRHTKDQRSLRWHLLPVRMTGGGIQHAKLSLLLWERHLRIIIGSANLTPAGYRSNREVVTALDFDSDGGAPLALARGCIDFLEALTGYSPGSTETPGPRAALASFLSNVRRSIRGWVEFPIPTGAATAKLIPILPQRDNALKQLGALWRTPAAHKATIISPFFDSNDEALDLVYRRVTELLTTRGERTIDFWTSGRTLADGQVEIDIPERLFRNPRKHRSADHELGLVDEVSTDEGGAHRSLHAKVFILDRDGFSLFMLGSSNFTLRGLGLIPACNAELNLAYLIPGPASAFYNACTKALPDAEDVTDEERLLFTATDDSSQGDTSQEALLPVGFQEALFRPTSAGGDLLLSLDPATVPRNFEVHLPTPGSTLLTAKVWSDAHASASEVVLTIDRPISSLTVHWEDAGIWRSAPWVVNVTDTSLLAPPAELNNLNLEDILQLLTSAKPIHWVLAERLSANDLRQPPGVVAIDPLKKVDTTQFLMRRMRRLARALEGLRIRLEQPVSSIEALRWRLNGPFGPLALARALQCEAGPAAPFFITEVAGTLAEIQWHSATAVTAEERDTAVREALRALKALAVEGAAAVPANLRQYVSEQLAGIQS